MWNTGVTMLFVHFNTGYQFLTLKDPWLVCTTTKTRQNRLVNINYWDRKHVCVYCMSSCTSTTPTFHSRLLVKLRGQWISLCRCSCMPTIRSMTALHSNGGIKERAMQTSTGLPIFHFLIPSLQPSDRVPLTAAALQRQMICAATWFRPLLPSASFLKALVRAMRALCF